MNDLEETGRLLQQLAPADDGATASKVPVEKQRLAPAEVAALEAVLRHWKRRVWHARLLRLPEVEMCARSIHHWTLAIEAQRCRADTGGSEKAHGSAGRAHGQ